MWGAIFFCLIILAFSIARLRRHTIFSVSCLPFQWQHPFRQKTKQKTQSRKWDIRKARTKESNALLRRPPNPLRLHLPHRSLPLVLAIPIFLHRGSRSSYVGALQRSKTAGLHLSSPDAPIPLRPLRDLLNPRPLRGLLNPRPQLGLLVFPPRTVLE